jgi:hypothetical protein
MEGCFAGSEDAVKKPTARDRLFADELTGKTHSVNICTFIYILEIDEL